MATLKLPAPRAPTNPALAEKPTVFAKGLRNTIGFAWHPTTGDLWGMDHGIDWLGDDEQGEELNLLEKDADYGWPVVYEANKINGTLPDKLPGGMTKQEYASRCTPSTLLTTAHSAPMQMAFAPSTGAMGEAVKNDAFLALHGSWNRKPPSGYSVARIRFDAGGAARPPLSSPSSPAGSPSPKANPPPSAAPAASPSPRTAPCSSATMRTACSTGSPAKAGRQSLSPSRSQRKGRPSLRGRGGSVRTPQRTRPAVAAPPATLLPSAGG